MEDHRLPKQTLFDELCSGHRDAGGSKERYKDSLKNLSLCKTDHNQWTSAAANRQTWRSTVHRAVSSFESNRRAGLEENAGGGKSGKWQRPILTKQLSAAASVATPVFHRSVASATRRPADDMDVYLHKPSVAKPSQNKH